MVLNMITLKLNINIVGNTLTLTENDAEPWSQTVELMNAGTKYSATLVNGFTVIDCTIMKITANEIVVVFNETVVLPAGACIVIDLVTPAAPECGTGNESGCIAPSAVPFESLSDPQKSDLQVVIFDQNNCPLLSLTLGQLKLWIAGD